MEEKKYEFNVPTNPQSIIKVIGVGGGGSNAVNHMYKKGIKDVDFVVCNTDLQALNSSAVPAKLQIGANLTQGLGAGANPEIGREAALESKEEVRELLSHDTRMLFITAGMGGGTGTGAAPVLAEIARELGVLTVAIVTSPFSFEGKKKRAYAEAGVKALKDACDTVLVISNDKLREIYGNLKMSEAFAQADNILTTAAKSIAEIITVEAEVNVDFEDVKTVMRNSGAAVMGSAKTEGENRALRAAQEALNSPLLDNRNILGSKKILLSIVSGDKAELQMDELAEITDYIQDKAGEDAEVIFGWGTDAAMGESIRVTIIATGFADQKKEKPSIFDVDKEKAKAEAEENKNKEEQENQTSDTKSEEDNSVIFEVNSKPKVSKIEKVEPPTNTPSKVVFNLYDDVNKDDQPSNQIEEMPKSDYDLKKEHLTKQAGERINKLRQLSQNIDNNEMLEEKIKVPAYLRRNVKLSDSLPNSSNNADNTISRYNLGDNRQILGNNNFFGDSNE